MKAELLNPDLPAMILGEGPGWDAALKEFHWVDIAGKAIHHYAPATKVHRALSLPSMVGFTVYHENGKMISGLQDGLYQVDPINGKNEKLIAPDNMAPHNRFNDGKCDRAGRLWCGTMNLSPDDNPPTGSLYRLDHQNMQQVEQEIYISNGLGWSPDNATMYYTDTVRNVIWQYDYDYETGTPHNRRIFKEFSGEGRPDGLCVDSAGRILTAQWPGWGVEIYTPDGKLDARIELPVPQVSSCAFGGEDFKTLLITTAADGMKETQLKEAPLSGQVFAVQMDIAGLPETACRYDLR